MLVYYHHILVYDQLLKTGHQIYYCIVRQFKLCLPIKKNSLTPLLWRMHSPFFWSLIFRPINKKTCRHFFVFLQKFILISIFFYCCFVFSFSVLKAIFSIIKKKFLTHTQTHTKTLIHINQFVVFFLFIFFEITFANSTGKQNTHTHIHTQR